MSKVDEFADDPTQDAIAKRAYELYLQRGSTPGYELDDWLAAKAELTAAGSLSSDTAASDTRIDSAKPTDRSNGSESQNDSRRNGRDRGVGRRAARQPQSQ